MTTPDLAISASMNVLFDAADTRIGDDRRAERFFALDEVRLRSRRA
jgi:hypothetical protein